ncbi:MAG: hypothetical protein ABT05_08565 [Lautropia sp. SCN 66-9]|nr:MAG: hypothetical protein ABT05_08565 [Lautropia sp. SCN 66-9]
MGRLGRHAAAAAAAVLLLGGCATAGGPTRAASPSDPFIYSFNDAFDRAVAKPVAQAYDDVMPQTFRHIIGSVFSNAADAWTAVNQLLQGKPTYALSDLTRVVINSTVGLAGMADIASEIGLEKHQEDFGQTLGRWGVPAGPYLVLPFLGPSSLRDAPAWGVDAWFDPLNTINAASQRNAAWGLRLVETRAGLLRAEGVMDGAALDRYSFLRDGYLQRRYNQVHDGAPPPPSYDDEDDDEADAPAPAGK